MAKYYCDCGAATEYSFNLPKFCSTCGSPREKTTASVLKSKPVTAAAKTIPLVRRPTRFRQEEEEYQEENFEIPELSIADIEIEVARPRGEKLGDVAKQEKTGFGKRKGDYNQKKIKAEFLTAPQGRATPTQIGGDSD